MVGLICLLVIFIASGLSQQCSKPLRSIKGSYLTGHVISSGSTAGVGDCLVECTADPRCKSINFRFQDLLCELNDADRYTHPWDYGSKEGHTYSDYPYKVRQRVLFLLLLFSREELRTMLASESCFG